jgi:putative tryptophan/tyrosine transport system substrate-binding protein
MRRRTFLTLVGGAAALPFAARAQQTNKAPRIGLLMPNSAAAHEKDGSLPGFREGLSRLGYVEGMTVVIEKRFADGKIDLLPELAAELVASKVDVIVTAGEGVEAACRATKTVPIVMGTGGDVVALGLAKSLAHPGGNLTGTTVLGSEILAKKLELLKQVLPSARRVGVLVGRGQANIVAENLAARVAGALDVQLQPFEGFDAASYEAAFSSASAGSIGGFVIGNYGQFYGDVDLIVTIANRHRVPTVGAPYFAEKGMLIGYGVGGDDVWPRAAAFVDKILKGVKPGDIPIERATLFHTVVNLKTAGLLGLEIPPLVLAAADEVVE